MLPCFGYVEYSHNVRHFPVLRFSVASTQSKWPQGEIYKHVASGEEEGGDRVSDNWSRPSQSGASSFRPTPSARPTVTSPSERQLSLQRCRTRPQVCRRREEMRRPASSRMTLVPAAAAAAAVQHTTRHCMLQTAPTDHRVYQAGHAYSRRYRPPENCSHR